MKKLIVMIMLVAGFSVVANAQTKKVKNPEQRAQHMTAMLQKKLNLTADQSAKVNAIFLSRAAQMDSLKQHRTADRKANHEARKAIMVNVDGQLKGILTADQQKTYAELKANMKEKMKHRRGAKAPAKG